MADFYERTGDIENAIKYLYRNNCSGIFNIGTGKRTLLSNIAKYLSKKQNKKIIIIKNNKKSSLIANNSKLKKTGWRPKLNIYHPTLIHIIVNI